MSDTPINEAHVIMAKCRRDGRTFGVRMEKKPDNVWHSTWAFPISAQAAGREGYDADTVSGKMTVDSEYPGCPYCGARSWFRCSCGKLNCWADESTTTCQWCGSTAKCTKAERFDLRGGDY